MLANNKMPKAAEEWPQEKKIKLSKKNLNILPDQSSTKKLLAQKTLKKIAKLFSMF
jgi:hypothetical protein